MKDQAAPVPAQRPGRSSRPPGTSLDQLPLAGKSVLIIEDEALIAVASKPARGTLAPSPVAQKTFSNCSITATTMLLFSFPRRVNLPVCGLDFQRHAARIVDSNWLGSEISVFGEAIPRPGEARNL